MSATRTDRPNVVFVFGDQWRAQATGYAGQPNVRTPNLDRLASRSVNFAGAVSGAPVCSPYRASLITGQYPLTHGVFHNDVCLSDRAVSIAQAFGGAGYRTAYIGKWHLDGHGRSSYIPPERRQGFEFWKVLECTHDYNHSAYYAGDDPTKRFWDGYDAAAQTREARRYLREDVGDKPFLLMLSWGPPHNPYHTAPREFRELYEGHPATKEGGGDPGPAGIVLRPNVPEASADAARKDLAGYYAHCSALDACVGDLLETLAEQGLEENTIFVFTSDHGDMLGSHGQQRKQRPWEESIRVPFLLRWPGGLGDQPRRAEHLIDAPDVMPTLLSLAGIEIPRTVEGRDLSAACRGAQPDDDEAALLMCIAPFGEFARAGGGREYRGLRTLRHTYTRDRTGPWLLYDNVRDPYQLRNLVDDPAAGELRDRLDAALQARLDAMGDEFREADYYNRLWGYEVDETGTVPYTA